MSLSCDFPVRLLSYPILKFNQEGEQDLLLLIKRGSL